MRNIYTRRAARVLAGRIAHGRWQKAALHSLVSSSFLAHPMNTSASSAPRTIYFLRTNALFAGTHTHTRTEKIYNSHAQQTLENVATQYPRTARANNTTKTIIRYSHQFILLTTLYAKIIHIIIVARWYIARVRTAHNITYLHVIIMCEPCIVVVGTRVRCAVTVCLTWNIYLSHSSVFSERQKRHEEWFHHRYNKTRDVPWEFITLEWILRKKIIIVVTRSLPAIFRVCIYYRNCKYN